MAKKLNLTEEAIKNYVMTRKAKEFTEFVNYCKDKVKKSKGGAYQVVWELSNGDEIYFQRGFKKPHVISPEPFKGSERGGYGYEGTIEWFMAFNALEQDGQFELEDED